MKYRMTMCLSALALALPGIAAFAQSFTEPETRQGASVLATEPAAENPAARRTIYGFTAEAASPSTVQSTTVEPRLTPPATGGWAVVRHARGTEEHAKMYEALKTMGSDEASLEESTEAREKVTSILSKMFDDDLDNREKQIDALEAQIAELRKQVAKRKSAKERLIDLRIELLVNEMQGLGFPNSWNSPNGSPSQFPQAVRSVPRAPAAPPTSASRRAPATPALRRGPATAR